MKKLINVEHGNQWENIRINSDTIDNWTLKDAIVELKEIEPTMENIPRLSYDTQLAFSGNVEHVEIVNMGNWKIKCYSDRLIITQDFFHTISIPPIMYSDIKEMSFDTYIDSSKLVAIWIDMYNGNRWTISTVDSRRK